MRSALHHIVPLILILLLIPVASSEVGDMDEDGVPDEQDACPETFGNSTLDRLGCMDTDEDGWSDPDENWTAPLGADAFPEREDAWSDTDGDGFPNQPSLSDSDDCPFKSGTSRVILKGCSDIDRDHVPDLYDDDADGDGIRNEMERAASTGRFLFDPFDASSTPEDRDFDTIPDVLDDDNDNDGWPDEIEIDRGSNHENRDITPLNQYFGIQTGFIYHGGLSFDDEYDEGEIEISLSWFISILTGELVIPIALIPIYVFLFVVRRRKYNTILTMIEVENDLERLFDLEMEVNELVRARSIKVYHGLVLRNALEERENILSDRIAQIKGRHGDFESE